MGSVSVGRMYDPLFSTPAMTEVLSDRNFVRQMFLFERGLAEALEENQVIPNGTAEVLGRVEVDSFDLESMAKASREAGNLCIPFVKTLTARVAEIDAAAAAYIHWGATSQDVIDSALMLQMRAGLDLLEGDLAATCASLATQIQAHRGTVMAGRTWLQQGPPVTLGLKLATWLDALLRCGERLREARERAIALQFGGAVGTLAALGGSGIEVSRSLGRILELKVPAIPWHSQRDRIGELACSLGLLAGSVGKIGRDVSLLMQTEVGEVMEPAKEGRGESSTMPHKRNPVHSAVMLAAAMRVPGLVGSVLSAMVQEHERGPGGWHAEWETMGEIFRLVAGALAGAREIALGMTVNADAMRRNLRLLQGVTMAEAVSFEVARKIGKAEAHRILEAVSQRAVREGISMQQALEQETSLKGHFSAADFERLLAPANYLGSTDHFIDGVLAKQEQVARGHHATS